VSRPLLERQLRDVADRLKRLRADAGVLAEQLEHFESEATDAELRALVSETPLADHEARAARRHADAHRRQRDDLLRSIADLEREQDSLLDRMAAELPDPRS
jgi:chromosome segregation ATPase